MLIRDGVSIRDGVHSGSYPFGIVSTRDRVHSGLCLFGIVPIRDRVQNPLWGPNRTEDKHIEDYVTWLQAERDMVQWLVHLTSYYYCSSLIFFSASQQRYLISTELFKFKNISSSYKIAHFHKKIKELKSMENIEEFSKFIACLCFHLKLKIYEEFK